MEQEIGLVNGLAFRLSPNAGKARCEPGWSWHPAPLTDYDFWYVAEGSGSITVNGAAHAIAKGVCFLLRPGDRVHAVQDPDNRLLVFYLHFHMESGGQRIDPPSGAIPDVRTEPDDSYRFEHDLNRLLELGEPADPWREAEADLLLKLVWLQLLRVRYRGPAETPLSFRHRQYVQRVVDHIREHIGEPAGHEELAALVGLSPRYLSGLFKQYTGHSLKAYITRMRMERARLLLAETTMNVTEAAAAVGYTDLYFFSKLFKNLHGVPPSYFRRVAQLAEKHT